MSNYPAMLQLQDKTVVIVGGGKIAYRKAINLLQAGAQITVISTKLHEKMEQLWRENHLSWHQKNFEASDLNDLREAFIVVAATSSKSVNGFIARYIGHNQLVNVVDQPELSNFHVPAKLTRGDLTISVATGGASPILSSVIRDELAELYDESYTGYLEFLATVREKLKQPNFDGKEKLKCLFEVTQELYRKSDEKQNEFLQLIEDVVHKKKEFIL